MGKILFRLALLVAAFIGMILLIGSLLPRDFEIDSTIEISAAPAEVFLMINSLPNWQLWSTFNEERVAGLKIEYGPIREGEGAVQKWTDVRGAGKLWITKSVKNEGIEYDLQFHDFPTMRSSIQISDVGGGNCSVKWTSSGSLPKGPFYGYSALFFSTQMSHQYSQGLERLKQIIEE